MEADREQTESGSRALREQTGKAMQNTQYSSRDDCSKTSKRTTNHIVNPSIDKMKLTITDINWCN